MADAPSDPRDVALAALTNLIRLIGAELVAGRHRDDVGQFERAVWDRIATSPTPDCSFEIAEAGLQLAGRCIEQALAQVRAQAEATADADAQNPVDAGQSPKPSLH